MLFVVFATLAVGSYAAPKVKVGKTTLIGRDVTGLKQDFFGGACFDLSDHRSFLFGSRDTFR